MINALKKPGCIFEYVPKQNILSGIEVIKKRHSRFENINIENVSILDENFPVLENYYTRTPIYNDGLTEIIVCVWNNALKTNIHNHGGSDCSFIVIQGKLIEETVYVQKNCFLNRIGNISRYLDEGDSAYISDPYRFHKITSSGDTNIVSVHMYSPPLREFSELLPTGKFIVRAI